jgi:predicted RNA methylase
MPLIRGSSVRIADTLRHNEVVGDLAFDAIYPAVWRARSRRFWTPVEVALLAAKWLTEGEQRRVLDVGSGVGKLCIVGALATDCQFVGLEQRESLIEAARQGAATLGVSDATSFVHGTIEDFDFTRFDSFYFYNPFGENLYSEKEHLDTSVELSVERYHRDAHLIEQVLDAAKEGARVVTYHGIGGPIPNSFSPVRSKQIGSDVLRLWVKTRKKKTGRYIELYTQGASSNVVSIAPPEQVSER